FADKLNKAIYPAFAVETARAADEDLSKLDAPALLERLEYWIRRTLFDFARDSLKPTALAAVALGNVERSLVKTLGVQRSRAIVGEVTMGVRPDAEADLPGAVRDLAAGTIDKATFLHRFGHRGSQEMELSQPRWSEDPA